MPIHFQYDEIVRTTPERAFAVIDNLPRTADWLPPCVSLTKVNDGPNAVGDKLRYIYRQGGREAEMVGEILSRVSGERLHCKYHDGMFEVFVDLRVSVKEANTLTTHIVEIVPKTFTGKLMAPLIRFGLKKQTREAAKNLKRLLEANNESAAT